jgi:hypothetical protein
MLGSIILTPLMLVPAMGGSAVSVASIYFTYFSMTG